MKLWYILCMCGLPLRHLYVNSSYGYRVHPVTRKYAMHSGVDLRAKGDTIFSIMNGVVLRAAYDPLLGLHIKISHSGDLTSIYGHLSQAWVNTGDTVAIGQPIGITGSTGRATGEHLHFAITYRDQPINPIKFLYEILKKQENEQKLQSTAGADF